LNNGSNIFFEEKHAIFYIKLLPEATKFYRKISIPSTEVKKRCQVSALRFDPSLFIAY